MPRGVSIQRRGMATCKNFNYKIYVRFQFHPDSLLITLEIHPVDEP